MKDNTSKLPLTYSLFIAGNPNSILLPLSKFSEPVTLCQELIIIKVETSCCEEGAMHRRVYIPLSNSYSLVTPCSISSSIEATHPIFACAHLIRPTFRRRRCAHWEVLGRTCWCATRSDYPNQITEKKTQHPTPRGRRHLRLWYSYVFCESHPVDLGPAQMNLLLNCRRHREV